VNDCGTEVLVELDDDVDVVLLDEVDVVGAVEEVLLDVDVVGAVEEVVLLDDVVVLLGTVEVVDAIVVVVTVGRVELLLDDVEVLELVVVVLPSQGEKSSVHSGVQVGSGSSTRAPPGDPFGHMAPPRSSPSHSSPASLTPLPHTGWGRVVLDELVLEEVLVVLATVEVVGSIVVLVLIVVVTVGTVEVLLLDDVVVLELVVVVPPSQGEKSSVHSGVQVGSGSSTRAPPGDPFGHVAPPRSSPSHSSPASLTPLPHTGWGRVVLDDVLVDVLDEVVVVVPAAGMPATLPMARMRRARNRPRSSAPLAMPRRAVGAQTCSMPVAPWPNCTSPSTRKATSRALRPEPSAGPVWLALPNCASPATKTLTGAAAERVPPRATRTSQKT
jgi:hypothetical protein